jgi:biopolymer transport protein TolR
MAGMMPRRGGRRRYHKMAEINVTPLVDVMLVLLIIFMVAAPLLTVGVPVDLPKTKGPPLPQDDKPVAVSIDAQGRVFLQETEVNLDELVPRLKAISGENPEARIYVRGDQGINYGRVMEVMGTINAGGFAKVALVAEPPKPK